jgi:hypothetical protein
VTEDPGIRKLELRQAVSRALRGKSVSDLDAFGYNITSLLELICFELDLLDPETMRFK